MPAYEEMFDPEPARWIGEHLHSRSFGIPFEVSMTVPAAFEAYARIFHPLVIDSRDDRGRVEHQLVSWTDMAHRRGRTAHALMEYETITVDPANANIQLSAHLGMSDDQHGALAPLLDRHTQSSLGWYLVWDGYGFIDDEPFGPPTVRHALRDYHLFRGPQDAYRSFRFTPSYFWPDDRSWCLSTDTDFVWTYLAGTRSLIDQTTASQVLDAYETVPTNPAHSGMDTVNDPNGEIARLLGGPCEVAF